MLDNIIKSCSYLLNNCHLALETKNYLDNRLSSSIQEIFEFGYFPSVKDISLLTSLIDENDLIKNHLLYYREHEDSCGITKTGISFFENYNLVMPYKDVYGETIAIVGRTIMSENNRKTLGIAKYKNTIFNKGHHLFGLYNAKSEIIKNNFVIVVEGQFDAIKAYENNIFNVVALGNANMTSYQFSLISRYTDNIYLLLDDDEAGQKGQDKIHKKFGHLALIKNLSLPKGFKDLDEYLTSSRYINSIGVVNNGYVENFVELCGG